MIEIDVCGNSRLPRSVFLFGGILIIGLVALRIYAANV